MSTLKKTLNTIHELEGNENFRAFGSNVRKLVSDFLKEKAYKIEESRKVGIIDRVAEVITSVKREDIIRSTDYENRGLGLLIKRLQNDFRQIIQFDHTHDEGDEYLEEGEQLAKAEFLDYLSELLNLLREVASTTRAQVSRSMEIDGFEVEE